MRNLSANSKKILLSLYELGGSATAHEICEHLDWGNDIKSVHDLSRSLINQKLAYKSKKGKIVTYILHDHVLAIPFKKQIKRKPRKLFHIIYNDLWVGDFLVLYCKLINCCIVLCESDINLDIILNRVEVLENKKSKMASSYFSNDLFQKPLSNIRKYDIDLVPPENQINLKSFISVYELVCSDGREEQTD